MHPAAYPSHTVRNRFPPRLNQSVPAGHFTKSGEGRMRSVVAVIAGLSLAGCMSAMGLGYEVRAMGDEFNPSAGMRMSNNFLDGTPITGGRVSLDAGHLGTPAKDAFLRVEYIGSEWAFIERGESLILLIDGQRVALEGNGSAGRRNVVSGSVVTETAVYPASVELIRRIASANQVRVRVSGSRQNLDRTMGPLHIGRFKAFADQHMPAN